MLTVVSINVQRESKKIHPTLSVSLLFRNKTGLYLFRKSIAFYDDTYSCYSVASKIKKV